EVTARDEQVIAARESDKWGFAPPGGESYAQVAVRIRDWYERLERDTVVAAHGGTARALIAHLGLAPPQDAAQYSIDQGVVYLFAEKGLTRYAGSRPGIFVKGGSSAVYGFGRWDLTATATRATTRRRAELYVVQHFRPPLQGHDLRRKPWARDRLRGRRLPGAHPADRDGHPALPRQAAARPVALHDAAPRAGSGENPLRRFLRRNHRPAGDDGNADCARHRECRPAREGLFRHQGQVSARARRLHLRRQIRHPRLSRRRPSIRTRDRHAGCRGRDRAQNRAGAYGPGRVDPN